MAFFAPSPPGHPLEKDIRRVFDCGEANDLPAGHGETPLRLQGFQEIKAISFVIPAKAGI